QPEVLFNIERDNISLDTYRKYQKQFNDIGHRTYSELIIPLPGETRESHIKALKQLIDSGVHELHVHNLRMLAGTKINSKKTREEFGFRSRFRLIHGDAGIYTYPSGLEERIFEYEESLRETATMSEDDMFTFRLLQFFIEFSWNMDVYGPLLKTAQRYGIHPIDIMMKFTDLRSADIALERATSERIKNFITRFEKLSVEEWFDSPEEIEAYFAKDENFKRLIELEFDKLNILCSVMLLEEYKGSFDTLIKSIIESYGIIPKPFLDAVAKFTFKRFPGLDEPAEEQEILLPVNIGELTTRDDEEFVAKKELASLRLFESDKRREVRFALDRTQSHTLSKIINTQRIYLRNLKYSLDDRGAFRVPLLFCNE
ncbi:MAG: hypothetical protein VCB07_03405, partial [Gammaproteobacteria bacterium]